MDAEFCDSFALIRMSSLIISYYDIKYDIKGINYFQNMDDIFDINDVYQVKKLWKEKCFENSFNSHSKSTKNNEKTNILKTHLILIVLLINTSTLLTI